MRITNSAQRWLESLPAVLEIGPVPGVQSLDKISYATPAELTGGLTGKASPGRKASATSGLTGIQVSAGTIMSQVLNNTNSFFQPGEPNHCGRLGGSSRWLILRPNANGSELLIDTLGSAIDTILAVYSSETIIGTRVEVACNHGTGGPAMLTFPASSSLYYWVVVDGLNGAQGLMQLNWRLGRRVSLRFCPSPVLHS